MNVKSIIALFAAGLTAASAFADSGVPADYPVKMCPISGETYGDGGMKPCKVTFEKTDVWLCCKNCKKDFDKDPAKYVKAVNDGASKQ